MIEALQNITLANPLWLLLLLIIPLYVYNQYILSKDTTTMVVLPHTAQYDFRPTWKTRLVSWMPIFSSMGWLFLVLAMSRPQLNLSEEVVKAEGIDIIIAMDISSSMLAKDFEPDRLEASKSLAQKFVKQRTHDRIGLIVFAGDAYTLSPVTTDHRIIIQLLQSIEVGMLKDGTAIGMGLSTAVNRLKALDSKSKVVIFLTDGVNNTGYIDPKISGEIAREMNIKVYTIGVGSQGYALMPKFRMQHGQFVYSKEKVEIDEELLKNIADITGGRYFRAADEHEMELIYNEIDQLEKTEMEVSTFRKQKDLYRYFVIIGLCLLFFYWFIKYHVITQFSK